MNDNTKRWAQTAINALSTAEAEMVRRSNPRHRAYEQISTRMSILKLQKELSIVRKGFTILPRKSWD